MPDRRFDRLPHGLVDDAELRARAAELRREWQADEEEWSRAALEHFRHRRTVVDVLRDAMHRGDVVVVGEGVAAPRGVVVHVGDDWCRLDTPAGVVDVPLGRRRPLVRISERSSRGGRGADPGMPARWRARLLGLESSGEPCVVETSTGDSFRGHVLVGADHVVVIGNGGGDEGEAYVPDDVVVLLRRSAP